MLMDGPQVDWMLKGAKGIKEANENESELGFWFFPLVYISWIVEQSKQTIPISDILRN